MEVLVYELAFSLAQIMQRWCWKGSQLSLDMLVVNTLCAVTRKSSRVLHLAEFWGNASIPRAISLNKRV